MDIDGETTNKMVFIERFIKNISEPKVSVSGTVLSSDQNGFLLEDKTGQIVIFSDKSVEQGRYVRILGDFMGDGIKAEIIQDLNSVDRDLHKKVLEMMQ